MSELWTRNTLYNRLRAIYAAKLALVSVTDDAARTDDPSVREHCLHDYMQGCNRAIESLLLAFGFSPQSFSQPAPVYEGGSEGSEIWFVDDLENLIVSLFLSATSMFEFATDAAAAQLYLRGFYDVLVAFLQSLGLSHDLLDEALGQFHHFPADGERTDRNWSVSDDRSPLLPPWEGTEKSRE